MYQHHSTSILTASAPAYHPTPHPHFPLPPSHNPHLRQDLLLALLLLVAALSNAATNVAAAKFTSAAWVNLVFMWTTVIVALINFLGFGSALPKMMWPASCLMMVGSCKFLRAWKLCYGSGLCAFWVVGVGYCLSLL